MMTHKERAKRRKKISGVAAKEGVAAAAREFGVCFATVRGSCYELGVTPAIGRGFAEKRWRRSEIAKCAEDEGVSAAAVKFGVCTHTVYDACRELDIQPVPGRGFPVAASTYTIIAELLNTTDSLTDIGVRHNLSRERVRQIFEKCHEAGIKVARRPRTRNPLAKKETTQTERRGSRNTRKGPAGLDAYFRKPLTPKDLR